MLSRASAAGFLLAASYRHAVEAQGSVPQALRGCWDDQFIGNSDSFLKITATEIDVSFAADYPVSGHRVLHDYTTTIDTEREEDTRLSGDGNDEDILYYCHIDYAEETAEAAADVDLNVDYSDLGPDGKGCNGFPFSRMQRSFDRDCIPEKCDKICKRTCPLRKRIFNKRQSKRCRNLRKKKAACECPFLLQCDCTRNRRPCPSCCQNGTCNKRQRKKCVTSCS